MNQSESLGNLFKALASAQSEIKGAHKDSSNPFYKSKYATLESVWEACREPLTKNGLSVSQFPCTLNNKPALKTVLGHSSGEFISDIAELNPTKNDPQGMGSAISYMRRYALAAVVGIYQEDDDANVASGKKEMSQATTSKNINSGIKVESKKDSIKKGISPDQKTALNTLLIELDWDPETIKNRFKMTTGKESSLDWTQEDFDKVLSMLKNVISSNPQLPKSAKPLSDEFPFGDVPQ